jgi:hypothetical protein
MMEVDFSLPVIAINHGTGERARSRAKSIPFIVNMDKDIIRAAAVQHFSGAISRYSFSPLAPKNDLSVLIDKIDADVDVIKKIPIELLS